MVRTKWSGRSACGHEAVTGGERGKEVMALSCHCKCLGTGWIKCKHDSLKTMTRKVVVGHAASNHVSWSQLLWSSAQRKCLFCILHLTGLEVNQWTVTGVTAPTWGFVSFTVQCASNSMNIHLQYVWLILTIWCFIGFLNHLFIGNTGILKHTIYTEEYQWTVGSLL